MNLISGMQVGLLLVDLLSMLSFILAIYFLALNPRHRISQTASYALCLVGISVLALSGYLRAGSAIEATIPLAVLSATIPAIGPAFLLFVISMFKSLWLTGKRLWLFFLFIFITLIPALLTIADVVWSPGFYLSQKLTLVYLGGLLVSDPLLLGTIAQLVILTHLLASHIILVCLLVYFSFIDRTLDKQDRRLARNLLVVQLLVVGSLFITHLLLQGIALVYMGALYVFGYGIVVYLYLQTQKGTLSSKLRARLTALIFAITIPAMVFTASSVAKISGEFIEQEANKVLQNQANLLASQIDDWLAEKTRMLANLASLPDITSMDAEKQKVILEQYIKNYPDLYLISTTDLNGVNLARSDDGPRIRYTDSEWYISASAGVPYSIHTEIERATRQPGLILSVPIYQSPGSIIGVLMCGSYLPDIFEFMETARIGDVGYAYLVSDTDALIVHSSPLYSDKVFTNFGTDPAILALRSGLQPPYQYKSDDGVLWRAYYAPILNQWAVVVQQQETELLKPYRGMQLLSLLLVVGGGFIVGVLVWVTLEKNLSPVTSLTKVVNEVNAGNIQQLAHVESHDEIGAFAEAFNSLIVKTRTLGDDLEQSVAKRTFDLEKRSAQLQAAAEVGHAAATIRNLDVLLPIVSRLISERFGFYHVGIFLIDDKREYALFRASNSAGGQRMLAREHKLKIGEQGIVGYVTATREPRVALNVGEDAVFFNNPDLPDTQSEMALPLVVGDELLGALDVQSLKPNAFTEQDVATLRVLADQVAIAINSAQLLQRTEELLEYERRGFGEVSRRAWNEQIRSLTNIGYSRDRSGLIELSSIQDKKLFSILQSGQIAVDDNDSAILYVPIVVRDQVIGVLRLQQAPEAGGWSSSEMDTMRSISEQLGVALESARAYQQTHIGALRDRTLGEISAKIRETLDVQSILRVAAQEVRDKYDFQKVVVNLGPPEGNGDGEMDRPGGGSNA